MCWNMISRLSTFLFGNQYTNPIPLSTLESYVESAAKKGKLEKEFELLNPTDKQLRSWKHSKIPDNLTKHRYYREPDSLLTYDHSRVVLDPIPGVENSDFIAANWVDSYNEPRRYIATQCPTPGTTNDFWRMVWQYEVQQVVNLTSPYDMESGKCFKYFPEETEATFSEIQVKLISKEETTDIVTRNYQLTKEKENRLLTHFHCRTWRDHEVPEHPQHLVDIIRKCRGDKLYTKSKPIVVHCVAGVGRTGTYILADSMLEMSQMEEFVDFLAHLSKIRNQRINMVARPEQYVCAHLAIVAARKVPNTKLKL